MRIEYDAGAVVHAAVDNSLPDKSVPGINSLYVNFTI